VRIRSDRASCKVAVVAPARLWEVWDGDDPPGWSRSAKRGAVSRGVVPIPDRPRSPGRVR
jgi:hypothetical protein